MTVRGLNAFGRFVLELCALAALAWWGVDLGRSLSARLILGVGLPVLAAVVWGNFVAPRAPRYAPLRGRVAIEFAFFGSATVGLVATGHGVLGTVFGFAAVVDTALHHVWKQDDAARAAIAARGPGTAGRDGSSSSSDG